MEKTTGDGVDDDVERWLGDVGGESPGGSGSGGDWEDGDFDCVRSVYDDYDQGLYASRLAVEDVPVSRVDETAAVAVSRVLADVASRQQRLEVANMRRLYVRGRAHIDQVYGHDEFVKQRLFRATGYMQMGDIQEPLLYERLAKGRVITRLSAPTASGKTRRLPGLVASRCGLRVLLVTLDAIVAKEALQAAREGFSVKTSDRMWIREKKAFVGAVSYHDFRGICKSGGRKRFFQDFDVFIFDEPHVKTAVVYNAKQCFAAFASESSSLLLLSATASTNADNDLAAKAVGRFEVAPVTGGFEGLMRSGKLISQYCVDRTLVLLAHAMKVYEAQAYYEEAGCDVRVMDCGTSRRDVEEIRRWLSPAEAAVPRVVVAVRDFGTAHNIPVSYVVSSCEAHVYRVTEEGGLEDLYVPVEEVEAKQHAGRSGRGMATGSGGIFCIKERASVVGELMQCELLEAYFSLIACGIKPYSGFLGDQEKLLPKSVSKRVARTVLSFTLPPLCVLRFLGSDGKVARRFSGALKLFLQKDHFLEVSVDTHPVGFDSWVEESLGGYMGCEEQLDDVKVVVPFHSPPTLRVVLHTIFAVSMGWLEIPGWYPEHSDDSESDAEDLGMRGQVKSRVTPVKLRVVTEQKPLPKVPEVKRQGWVFDADAEMMAKQSRRQNVQWCTTPVGRAVVQEIVRKADHGLPFDGDVGNVERIEKSGKEFVRVKRPDSIEVDSPGGTPSYTINVVLYDALMRGEVLTPGMFLTLVKLSKQLKMKFVLSTLFDSWGQPWLAVLKSCASYEVIKYVCGYGYGVTAKRLVEGLYDRFRSEVVDVCTTSNVYRSKVRRLWADGVSVTKLGRAIRKGKIPVAQSSSFVQRLGAIHELYSRALACMESCGVYNPALVTKVQQPLPLRGKNVGMPVVGESVVSQEVDPGGEWMK